MYRGLTLEADAGAEGSALEVDAGAEGSVLEVDEYSEGSALEVVACDELRDSSSSSPDSLPSSRRTDCSRRNTSSRPGPG